MTESELSKHVIFLNIAKEISKMSKCVSFKVGALIVKENRIISTGYNGTPAGYVNCSEVFSVGFDRNTHHDFSENFEIHAELNSILCAARNGINISGSILYSTLQPCNDCLKMICNSGIKEIFYANEYDKFVMNRSIKDMLDKCGVSIMKIQINR